MFIKRSLSPRHLSAWLARNVLWLALLNGFIAILYAHDIISISIPWLPTSVIGTAVAFFVGFKNNQAYDRLWEARKIWGGIVNDSRTWGMMVTSFIRPVNQEGTESIADVKKQLIYRHIAWLYSHRRMLLEPMAWEQVGAGNVAGKRAKWFDQKFESKKATFLLTI
jgi:putative membrane protein